MTHKDNAPSSRAWPIKALTAAVVVGLSTLSASIISSASVNRVGDLEIYKIAEPGTASIMLMLDVSGSMNRYDSSCKSGSSKKIRDDEAITLRTYKRNPTADSTEAKFLLDANGKPILDAQITFTPEGCYGSDGELKVDRITRLKIALLELLADRVYKADGTLKPTGIVPDDYGMGLGYFSYNGYAGVIQVPIDKLTPEHRMKLLKAAKNLDRHSGTPTSHGYAEAGAYMMGTTTSNEDIYPKVVAQRDRLTINGNSNQKRYRNCDNNETTPSYDRDLERDVLACSKWSTTWESNSDNRNSHNETAYGPSLNSNRYELKTYYYVPSSARNSGFTKSVQESKKADGKSYLSPINTDQCSGNGIYLLTDGEPSRGDQSTSKQVMNPSLQGSGLKVNQCNALTGGKSVWGCMGEYAQLLRNTNNPSGYPIKTATVGFGKEFDKLTGTKTVIVNGEEKTMVDCEKGTADSDAKNFCRLGEIDRVDSSGNDATLGGGGFYYTQKSQEIANSITDFAATLVQTINTAPSGTITIPNDPYRAANQLPYAYLPMLDPDVASIKSIWRGNLKKYSLNEGTLYGQSDNLLFKNVAGELNERTRDLWQGNADFKKGDKVANNDITAGGVYAKLKSPKSGLGSLRKVFVEDTVTETDATPILREVSVDSSTGKATDFAALKAPTYSNQLNKRRLLSFLGFKDIISDGNQTTLLTAGGQVTDNETIQDITMLVPSKKIKVLGGVVHSTPTAVSYGATLDDNGRITDTREDYVLFGSMDGALHLVNADSGEEAFAIIPKLMMETQPEALVENSESRPLGRPYFGVDAPWLVETDYNYDLGNNRVAASSMMAYGGLRMGGEAFYAINISDKDSPKIEFSITPNTFNGAASTKFARLGQIWSKPTTAKIRLTKGSDTKKNTAATDVLIFGGGYDMGYEDDDYVPTANTPAKGNAIYMINAKTGELIWSVSKNKISGSTVAGNNTSDMIHSFTGEITVLDRDNDGLMDHLYAADLGGQVFRADFENARIKQFGFEAVDKFSNKGVTRILKPSSTDKYAQRFYSRPVVSFYRSEGGANNGKIFALVNVISGNRSSPLSNLRDDNKYANRIYGIIDTDISNNDLYKSGFNASIIDLKDTDLVNLADELKSTPSAAKKTTTKNLMITGDKKGWYYPLTRFDGYQNVRYNKGVGNMTAINNILYSTVYNPDKLYKDALSCTAQIMGGSERQLYCLPYGICMDKTSATGTGGYIPAGQGIQELTLGAFNADNRDVKVLIGTTTITERIKDANRIDYGIGKQGSNIQGLYPGEDVRPTIAGGDGSATEFIFNERYTLQPRAWYQQKTGE